MKQITALVLIVLTLGLTACKTQNIIYETTEAEDSASVIDDVIGVSDETTTEETTAEKTTEEAKTTQAETTTEEATDEPEITEVDLSITLPEKNGSMYVDKDDSNKFTAAVVSARKIDASLLVAVYSLPESGQNYVFEFSSANKFTAENIRRVYLLDGKCNITGVAASKASESEKLSSTENWFCMNVLIKGVIFPAIKEQF